MLTDALADKPLEARSGALQLAVLPETVGATQVLVLRLELVPGFSAPTAAGAPTITAPIFGASIARYLCGRQCAEPTLESCTAVVCARRQPVPPHQWPGRFSSCLLSAFAEGCDAALRCCTTGLRCHLGLDDADAAQEISRGTIFDTAALKAHAQCSCSIGLLQGIELRLGPGHCAYPRNLNHQTFNTCSSHCN